jgi:hypothetical protein
LTLLVVATTDGDVKTAQVATIKNATRFEIEPPSLSHPDFECSCTPFFFLELLFKKLHPTTSPGSCMGPLGAAIFFFFRVRLFFALYGFTSLSLSLVPTPENAKLVFFVDRDRVRLP